MLMRCSVVRSVYFVQLLSVSRITIPLAGRLGVPFVIQRGVIYFNSCLSGGGILLIINLLSGLVGLRAYDTDNREVQ